MKRAGTDDTGGGGDSKKSTSSGGLKGMPGGVSDSKVNPIPRPLKTQEVTLHFTQRTWEEIGPGELKYLPLSQTPYYMFDNAMLAQLKKFKGLWTTAYYHTPKARLSNLIMLQDDLINQGGTPLETTAFTQACYMMKYTPTRQTQYFQLGTITDCNSGDNKKLTYDLSETVCGSDYRQLIPIGNYEDFEKLAIFPAKIDKYAGYQPSSTIQLSLEKESYIQNTFIAPNPNSGPYADFSANLQPYPEPIPVIKELDQVTWARNLDKISLHKYGDVVELPIHTNIEGTPLINDPLNDFTVRTVTIEDTEKQNKYTYNVEWCWPSSNRPYYSRHDNLSTIGVYEAAKSLSPISHTFLTMPPIRKANGALLKQRCSFILEQSFSVTFNTVESAWGEDSGDEYMLNQLNGVQIRPMIYGTTSTDTKDEGAFCPIGSYTCIGGKCPFDNSFQSLIDWMVDNRNFSEYSRIEYPSDYAYKKTPGGKMTENDVKEPGFQTVWKKYITYIATNPGSGAIFYFNCNQRAGFDMTSSSAKRYIDEAPVLDDKFITISADTIRTRFKDLGIKCGSKQHADYVPKNRETTMFYV